MRLYIVRHGESVDDIEDSYGGVADFPLTDRGREQARQTAEKLRALASGIEVVYSSPLSRALETAEIIAGTLALGPVVVIDDLQERNTYGVLSGVNKERAETLFRRILSQLNEKPGYSKETVLGGEDYEAFVARVGRALDALTADAAERRVKGAVIVTHGKFTQALFERVFRLGPDVRPQLSSISVVDHEPGRTAWVDQPFAAP